MVSLEVDDFLRDVKSMTEKNVEKPSKLILEEDTKRRFRFIMEIEGIPSFCLQSAARPVIHFGSSENICQPFSVTLFDPELPSLSKSLWEWHQKPNNKQGVLKILNRDGKELERWTFINLYPQLIDFGKLNYGDANPVTITIYFRRTPVSFECLTE